MKSNNFSFFLICILLGTGVGYFLTHRQSETFNQSSSQTKQDLVNKHLTATYKNMDSSKAQAQSLKTTLGPKQQALTNPYSVLDDNSAYRNSRDESRNSGQPESPAEVIQMEMYKQQMQNAANEEYRKEYARQYIEHARGNGYEVKLDSDLKVISVKPLRQPSQQEDDED